MSIYIETNYIAQRAAAIIYHYFEMSDEIATTQDRINYIIYRLHRTDSNTSNILDSDNTTMNSIIYGKPKPVFTASQLTQVEQSKYLRKYTNKQIKLAWETLTSLRARHDILVDRVLLFEERAAQYIIELYFGHHLQIGDLIKVLAQHDRTGKYMLRLQQFISNTIEINK